MVLNVLSSVSGEKFLSSNFLKFLTRLRFINKGTQYHFSISEMRMNTRIYCVLQSVKVGFMDSALAYAHPEQH